MTKQEFYTAFEETLEIPSGSIKGTENLADLGAWDSLAAISFIAMADSVFGMPVTASKLRDCKTVDDLAAMFPGKVSLQ